MRSEKIDFRSTRGRRLTRSASVEKRKKQKTFSFFSSSFYAACTIRTTSESMGKYIRRYVPYSDRRVSPCTRTNGRDRMVHDARGEVGRVTGTVQL